MIFIVCPANKATGGPELLHQLGYKLNMLGFDATMLYLNCTPGISPVCDSYQKYAVPWIERMHPDPEDIIILPEINIPLAPQLADYKCVIWWLSIDNAVYSDKDVIYMQQCKNLYHFAQSHYAVDFLNSQLHIPSERTFYLSDYLNSEFFTHLESEKSIKRDNVILFNPQKGFDQTSQLISKSDYRIKWQALKGLTPHGMRETLKQAKIYIDFGNHPGKDRIPREAAMCGCLVLTNRKGSAAYTADVPIPEDCKFYETDSVDHILSKIYHLLEEYDSHTGDYQNYLQIIREEYIQFEKDTLQIFTLLTGVSLPESIDADTCISDMLSFLQDGNYRSALKELVLYRLSAFPESITIDIIETAIRLGIGEYGEAKLSIERGLSKDAQNYELHLYAAQLHLNLGNPALMRQHCENALLFSRHTSDEQAIKSACDQLFSALEQIQ